jgi:hypothetical protein
MELTPSDVCIIGFDGRHVTDLRDLKDIRVGVGVGQKWKVGGLDGRIGEYVGVADIPDARGVLDYEVFLRFADREIWAFHPMSLFPVIEEDVPEPEPEPELEQMRLL